MIQDPRKLERVQNFLFASQEEMNEARLPPSEQTRLLRLRSTYTYWLQNPHKPEKDIAQFICQTHKVGQSAAYNDLRILKILLGNLNSATTEFYRWQFLQRCEEGFRMAREANDGNGDASAFARVLSAYLKGTQLDKEKAQTIDYNLIVPQTFEISGDPAVAGITVDPDAHIKAQKLLQRWRREMTEAPEVNFEELETDISEKPVPLHATLS